MIKKITLFSKVPRGVSLVSYRSKGNLQPTVAASASIVTGKSIRWKHHNHEIYLESLDTFPRRHCYQPDTTSGTTVSHDNEIVNEMLKTVNPGFNSIEQLVQSVIPKNIYLGEKHRLKFDFEQTDRKYANGEYVILRELYEQYAKKNKVMKSLIGMGYYNTITPSVILRNIMENPLWYTPYTPYQAEISQGRLEGLLNFQTVTCDLTGLPVANASLLDEATAAAEAMNLCYSRLPKNVQDEKNQFFVSDKVHPQTIAVIKTRAFRKGIEVIVGDYNKIKFDKVCGVLLQYPDTTGLIAQDLEAFVQNAHKNGAMVVVATDLLALTILKPPGEFGVDIALGSAQRFGVPLGYGGPHAAFFAVKDELKRLIPGRIIGISKDTNGTKAYRMALQTREQHIRRDKATSNICTAQALLANMAAMYAIYHGPEGLRTLGNIVHEKTVILAKGLKAQGHKIFNGVENPLFFDTLQIELAAETSDVVMQRAVEAGYNLRKYDQKVVGLSIDETITGQDIDVILKIFDPKTKATIKDLCREDNNIIAKSNLLRKSAYLTHQVFNSYQTEHELLRYINRLQMKDISLAYSMIPLGSCTMKLNATSEMIPVTWREFSEIHPFVPLNQVDGYQKMINDLDKWLSEITGFAKVSMQPNAGSQGEFAGLMVIKQYLDKIGEKNRDVCLIPTSAHGTNPASAVMAGMRVVVVDCDKHGNIDVADLKKKAEQHSANLACLMVTYPSTHGVFEESIVEICDIIHKHGGQVYMDGANMNAQVGLTSPARIGADVCHLNLHKTFCIPHGGGGPGVGPIGVKEHLVPFLPSHPLVDMSPFGINSKDSFGPVSAAPHGSSSILPIVWMYIRMMGSEGLRNATQMAILNANYMAKRLEPHYKILYRGKSGYVAHEFIIDINPFRKTAGIEAEDIAKRLMDYGFHAPTMSFPIAGTLMIEPTESESKRELDKFCDALIQIRQEIRDIEEGKVDRTNNVLKNAPHVQLNICADKWDRPYSREQAAFPTKNYQSKMWPAVSRIDGAAGDRNLICTCPPLDSYQI
jgi:glycine dehydrogenase